VVCGTCALVFKPSFKWCGSRANAMDPLGLHDWLWSLAGASELSCFLLTEAWHSVLPSRISWIAPRLGSYLQVRRHGFWPTVRRLLLTGWQQNRAQRQGPRQPQQQQAPQGQGTLRPRQRRFDEVARTVYSLPMEDFVTREDLQQCSLHDLRVGVKPAGFTACAIHAKCLVSPDRTQFGY
jgi:hypothetical protein